MFSDRKSGNTAVATLNAPEKDNAQTTVIAKGTVIEGKFVCTDNVRIDGAVHGEVQVEKRLVLGDGSYVNGNIEANNAAIRGRVKGDITIKDALHLLDTAVIEGNIMAKTMVVEEGARYNGSCKIGDSAIAAKN